MFGISDNKNQDQNPPAAQPTVVAQSNAVLPDSGQAVPALPNEWQAPGNVNAQALPAMPAAAPGPLPAAAQPASDLDMSQLTPPVAPTPAPAAQSDEGAPEVHLDKAYIATDPPQLQTGAAKPTAASLVSAPPDDELLKMKQQALQSLAPLVDHLEQSPEEKFRTTMMLIQASDNADLVKEAYEAANQIKDEKTRAQALLDVINEINYFTHPGPMTAEPSYSV